MSSNHNQSTVPSESSDRKTKVTGVIKYDQQMCIDLLQLVPPIPAVTWFDELLDSHIKTNELPAYL